MPYEEKNAWAFGLVAIAGYVTYLAILLPRSAGIPLAETPYVGPMLATIGGAILAGILAGIVIGILSPRDRDKKDQRDREIYRFGEYVGRAFVVIGAVSALLLAMFEADHFWIANAVYLAFVLSAVLSTVARLVAYRRAFQSW
jgi:MFS family permease